MIKMESFKGEDKGKIVLYGLSTCGWCANTKKFLQEMNLSYSFVDVDLLTGEDSQTAMNEIERWNPMMTFPTIVINDKVCIVGYDTEGILGAISQ